MTTAPIHERIQERLARILQEDRPEELAARFAQHIFVGPMTARAIVADMAQNFEIPEGQSAFDVLKSQMLTMLLARVQLEIGAVEGKDAAELYIFPFGREQPLLSFPFQALRYDWFAMACLQRFHLQGRCNDEGMRLFHQDVVTPDRTRATYMRFAYNAVMGNAMQRTYLLAVYLSIYAAQAFEHQNCGPAAERNPNAVEHARELMKDCLEAVALKLTEVHEKPALRRAHPSCTDMLRGHVRRLLEACGDPKRFTSSEMGNLAVQFAREQLRAAKQ